MPIFPISSLDPFADDFLAAPYPFYAGLRDAGPVVWLERYGLWACARHAEVQAALSDWQTFSSAAGVGIDDFRRTKPWRPPSLAHTKATPKASFAVARRRWPWSKVAQ
jgi:4-methoxybenzoate monooxygenase (O-demethylating)